MRATEIIFPIGVFLQGLPWALPHDSFALSRNYDIMRLLGSEQTWGIVWMVLGVILATMVMTRFVAARRIALSVCGGMFLFVGLSIILSNPYNTFAYPILVLAVASTLVGVEVR